MLKLTKSFSVYFLLFTIGILSCNKKDLRERTKCKVSLADTSFRIEEPVGFTNNQRFFSTDTIIASYNDVYFSANDTTADEYSWQFGGDPRTFNSKTVKLAFEQPFGTISITLKQKRNPDNPCFGLLPPEVTYTRTLTIIEPSSAPILGNFYG